MSNGYEMMFTDFRKFGDVVIDLQKMAMLTDDGVVVLTDGTKMCVGKEAADAIRSYFTPASGRQSGQRSDTGDTAKGPSPSLRPDSLPSEEECEATQGQLEHPSCVDTSFPAGGPATGEDATAGGGAQGETGTTGTQGTTGMEGSEE